MFSKIEKPLPTSELQTDNNNNAVKLTIAINRLNWKFIFKIFLIFFCFLDYLYFYSNYPKVSLVFIFEKEICKSGKAILVFISFKRSLWNIFVYFSFFQECIWSDFFLFYFGCFLGLHRYKWIKKATIYLVIFRLSTLLIFSVLLCQFTQAIQWIPTRTSCLSLWVKVTFIWFTSFLFSR